MALKELLFDHSDRDLTRIEEYRAVGGYEGLRTAFGMERDAVIEDVLNSGLRGRGGAGFPAGRKAGFIPKPGQRHAPAYLTVNADESEPGTFKDREIMLRIPHAVIEGSLMAAYGIDAGEIFIYLRGEYLQEFEVMKAALEEARAEGLVGDDILGSGWGCTIVLHRGAGAYICGEETALLESLEGNRGQPRSKPPFPAISGVYGAPTLINNVETLATYPFILRMGGGEYAKLGVENSAGTRVFSLSGNVANGGNYELELGTPLRELVYEIGGGIPGGRQLKAIIPGGSSVPVLSADEVDTPLDFDAMAEAGTMLGSGAVIVIDDRACMVQLGLRVAQFYMHESCGKCTPCREGTRWMVQILKKLEDGTADQGELDLLLNVCDRILGNCLCPLGDAAAMPIASYVAKFREEYQRHIDEGGCPFGGESSLAGVLAPVDQHHAHQRAQIEVPVHELA
ncbi:MAG: NADH-quinone oxidoreductase subunit NuoF [Actinobacteria bacterium]|nr:NADH-quinone oxidoreductase subunit NuoF [Actinomycetota bacterium]